VAKEVMGYLKKKIEKNSLASFQSYHQIWRFKSALVAGE